MKPLSRLLSSCLMIGFAAPALAASTTDLTVKGLIVPSACTPSLSSAGLVDHGKISVGDLKPTAITYLQPVSVQLSVDCEAKTLLALMPTDNRKASGIGPYNYGIGLVDGKKLGAYSLVYDNVLADGETPRMLMSWDSGTTWQSADDSDMWDFFLSVGDVAGPRIPVPVQNLSMDLSIRTYIHPTQNLPVAQEMIIDGSATIAVHYL